MLILPLAEGLASEILVSGNHSLTGMERDSTRDSTRDSCWYYRTLKAKPVR
jgi:hypothetical protein